MEEHVSQTERQIRALSEHFAEDTMTKVDGIYTNFEAFEEQLAHCYFLLHGRFIAIPRLAKFWAEAALDELQHGSILRFCRERGLTATDIEVDLSAVEHIKDLLDTVTDIVSDPDVTVDEAFYASLLMESSELDDVYEKLTRALAKDHLLLYQAIQASLRSHYDTFADGAEECSGDKGLAAAFSAFGRAQNAVATRMVS